MRESFWTQCWYQSNKCNKCNYSKHITVKLIPSCTYCTGPVNNLCNSYRAQYLPSLGSKENKRPPMSHTCFPGAALLFMDGDVSSITPHVTANVLPLTNDATNFCINLGCNILQIFSLMRTLSTLNDS